MSSEKSGRYLEASPEYLRILTCVGVLIRTGYDLYFHSTIIQNAMISNVCV
jgi:hypothetical protein